MRLHAPSWTLSVQVEQIEVTSDTPRLDPAWEYVDEEGHKHRYDADKRTPTLTWVVDEPGGVYVDSDGYPDDYPDEGHYECVICGEHITPGMRGPSLFREYVPGAVTATLDTPSASYYLNRQQLIDLRRRMSLTRDKSIWDRIIEQFIHAHPDQRR